MNRLKVNRLKQNMIIFSLFALLLAIVCAPLVYLEYQESRDIIGSEFYKIPDTSNLSNNASSDGTDVLDQTTDRYNIWERIDVVPQAVIVKANVGTESKTELQKMMESQLTVLAKYGALPKLSFDGLIYLSVFKDTFMDVDASSGNDGVGAQAIDQSVSVWEVVAEYQDFCVCIYMDTVTSAPYDITVELKKGSFVNYQTLSPNGLLLYLKTISDIPSDFHRAFSVLSQCTEDKISLCLYSFQPDGEEVVYRFNQYAGFPTYMIAVSPEGENLIKYRTEENLSELKEAGSADENASAQKRK